MKGKNVPGSQSEGASVTSSLSANVSLAPEIRDLLSPDHSPRITSASDLVDEISALPSYRGGKKLNEQTKTLIKKHLDKPLSRHFNKSLGDILESLKSCGESKRQLFHNMRQDGAPRREIEFVLEAFQAFRNFVFDLPLLTHKEIDFTRDGDLSRTAVINEKYRIGDFNEYLALNDISLEELDDPQKCKLHIVNTIHDNYLQDLPQPDLPSSLSETLWKSWFPDHNYHDVSLPSDHEQNTSHSSTRTSTVAPTLKREPSTESENLRRSSSKRGKTGDPAPVQNLMEGLEHIALSDTQIDLSEGTISATGQETNADSPPDKMVISDEASVASSSESKESQMTAPPLDWRLPFRNLMNPAALVSYLADDDNPELCDSRVEILDVNFHPNFLEKISQELGEGPRKIRDKQKNVRLKEIADAIQADLTAMAENRIPPSADLTHPETLDDARLSDRPDYEKEILRDQEGLYPDANEKGKAPTMFDGNFLTIYCGSYLKTKEDVDNHYIYHGKQGRTVEDIEHFLVEWQDGNRVTAFSGLCAGGMGARINTRTRQNDENPDILEEDEENLTAIAGPVIVKLRDKHGVEREELAMVFLGRHNLTLDTEITFKFGKEFVQKLNESREDQSKLPPPKNLPISKAASPLEKEWDGLVQAYENLKSPNRKYAAFQDNERYREGVAAFVEYAKAKQIPLDEGPERLAKEMQTWLQSDEGQAFGKTIAVPLNHLAQTHYYHKYKFDVTNAEVKRILTPEQQNEFSGMKKQFDVQSKSAGLTSKQYTTHHISAIYHAILETFPDDPCPLQSLGDMSKSVRKKELEKVRENFLNKLQDRRLDDAEFEAQETAISRVVDILHAGAIDKKNKVSMRGEALPERGLRGNTQEVNTSATRSRKGLGLGGKGKT